MTINELLSLINNPIKRTGSVVGAIGGAGQKVTGTENQPGFWQDLRNLGGKITNGTRNFNLVSSVGAQELSPDEQITDGGGGGGSAGGDDTNTYTGGSVLGSGDTSTENGGDVNLAQYLADLANARSYRDRGLQTIARLLESVNAFRNRAKTLFGDADQEITNQAAENLGSNATTAQGLAKQATAMGRNLGASAKLNAGQTLFNNLFKTQGSTLASKGEEQASNRALFQERNDEADAQEKAANNYRMDLEDAVTNMENQGATNYGARLQNVVDRANAISSLSPMNSSGLASYSPNVGSGVINTLNGLFSNGAGNVTTGVSATSANPYNSMSEYLKKLMSKYPSQIS